MHGQVLFYVNSILVVHRFELNKYTAGQWRLSQKEKMKYRV